MNRDPKNQDCTRDPIYLLQVGTRQWTAMPDGVCCDGDFMWVDDMEALPNWIRPFVDDDDETINTNKRFWQYAEANENEHGWPLVYIEWRTEAVFLTRQEAEDWVKAREHNYPIAKVYCVPCNGKLAEILSDIEEPTLVG
jgi:hypothetical protein